MLGSARPWERHRRGDSGDTAPSRQPSPVCDLLPLEHLRKHRDTEMTLKGNSESYGFISQ